MNIEAKVPVEIINNTATIFAGDYINKLSGERIERECQKQIDAGCKKLVVDFSRTEIVNSIGISILLGLIDAASNAGASVVFSDLNEETSELFDTRLMNHVTIQN